VDMLPRHCVSAALAGRGAATHPPRSWLLSGRSSRASRSVLTTTAAIVCPMPPGPSAPEMR
jgi:hypothetical protein